jgi:2-polyprenyl-3-methyl-5-hydroxy-6-metoxy-1,4-benzoquinol methylase
MNRNSVMDCCPGTDATANHQVIGRISRPCCPLCGEERQQVYGALSDWLFGAPGSWGMRSCTDCGMAWLDPQPAAEDISKLYSRYFTHRSSPKTRFDHIRQATSQCVLARMGYPVEPANEMLPRVLSHMRSSARAAALGVMNLPASQVGTLLDVGCGNGEFMMRMASLGWKVAGVDPDPGAAAWAWNQGRQFFCGTILDVPGSDSYDAITLSHVIEHAVDPLELLHQCRKRLRPDTGRLVITTPNLKSLGHWWFKDNWRGLEVPRHFYLFSPKSLSTCVARAGLSMISLSTETRMAHMIYSPSVCAKKGERDVGQRTDFKLSTKAASYLFQFLEDGLVKLKPSAGEEICCVCAAPANL